MAGGPLGVVVVVSVSSSVVRVVVGDGDAVGVAVWAKASDTVTTKDATTVVRKIAIKRFIDITPLL